MAAMSEEQFAAEDARRRDELKGKECIAFLTHGFTVIYDRCLLMEFEIEAGLEPPIDVNAYKEKLVQSLRAGARKLYGHAVYRRVYRHVKFDVAKYGIQ
jgi:hypothetical protein